MKEMKEKYTTRWKNKTSPLWEEPEDWLKWEMSGLAVLGLPHSADIIKMQLLSVFPPSTTTYYNNNTLSFCLLMIYFLDISHALDLIYFLLKCKLGSLPLKQIVTHKLTLSHRGSIADSAPSFIFSTSCRKEQNKTKQKNLVSKTNLHYVRVLEFL